LQRPPIAKGSIMKPSHLLVAALAAAAALPPATALADTSSSASSAPVDASSVIAALPTHEDPPAIVLERTQRGGGIGYLFAGNVTVDDPGAPPWTELAVGAQLNAHADRGSHQIVFGVATEAWAAPDSFSILTGIEATPINMEPDNPWPKVAVYATYKTRPDAGYDDVPSDPGNMNAQALRIESQPGTGFERGIVFSKHSLHASRNAARPILLDLREVPADTLAGWDLVAFPDGCRLRYAGHGRLAATC
jgi:hypothetical protein